MAPTPNSSAMYCAGARFPKLEWGADALRESVVRGDVAPRGGVLRRRVEEDSLSSTHERNVVI